MKWRIPSPQISSMPLKLSGILDSRNYGRFSLVSALINWCRLSGGWEKGLVLCPIAVGKSDHLCAWRGSMEPRQVPAFAPHAFSLREQMEEHPPRKDWVYSLIVNWGAQCTGDISQGPGVWLNHTDSSYPLLSHVWLSFSLLTGNAPKPDKFLINFYPCLHLTENWKNAFCWHRWLMVLRPLGSSPPHCRQFPLAWTCLSPSGQILFLALAPLSPPVSLSEAQSAAANTCRSCLCVSYPQETSYFHLMELPALFFSLKSSFSVQRILFNISTSQDQVRGGLPPHTQICYFDLLK